MLAKTRLFLRNKPNRRNSLHQNNSNSLLQNNKKLHIMLRLLYTHMSQTIMGQFTICTLQTIMSTIGAIMENMTMVTTLDIMRDTTTTVTMTTTVSGTMAMDTTDMTMVTLAPIMEITATLVMNMALSEVMFLATTRTGTIGDTMKPLIMKGTTMDTDSMTTLLTTSKTTIMVMTTHKNMSMAMDMTLDTPTITGTTENSTTMQTTVHTANTTMAMATQRVTTLPTTESTSINELIAIVNRRRKGCLFSCDDL